MEPYAGITEAAAADKPFAARVKSLELADGTVNLSDADNGIALALEEKDNANLLKHYRMTEFSFHTLTV